MLLVEITVHVMRMDFSGEDAAGSPIFSHMNIPFHKSELKSARAVIVYLPWRSTPLSVSIVDADVHRAAAVAASLLHVGLSIGLLLVLVGALDELVRLGKR